MLYDINLTWGQVQDIIENIENYSLDDEGKYLGLTPKEIMKKDAEEYVFEERKEMKPIYDL